MLARNPRAQQGAYVSARELAEQQRRLQTKRKRTLRDVPTRAVVAHRYWGCAAGGHTKYAR